MTNEPGAKSIIPPQFIDSNFIDLRDIIIDDSNRRGESIFIEPHREPALETEILGWISRVSLKRPSFESGDHAMELLRVLEKYLNLQLYVDIDKTEDVAKFCEQQFSKNKILKYFLGPIISLIEGRDLNEIDWTVVPELIVKKSPRITKKTLTIIIDELFGYRNYLRKESCPKFINFSVLYSLYVYNNHLRGIDKNVTAESFLRDLITQRGDRIKIQNFDKGTIIISRSKDESDPPIGGFGKVVRIKNQVDMSQFEASFLPLYRRYIRAMSSILSFTNCAGNRTRTAKLFAPELNFYFDKSMEEFAVNYDKLKKIHKVNEEKLGLYLQDYNDPQVEALKIEQKSLELAIRYNKKTRLKHINFGKMQKRLDGYDSDVVSFSDIAEYHLAEGKSVVPMVISGDAGMGKTTVMAQCSLSYFSKLEDRVDRFFSLGEELSSLPLPVVLKAKLFLEPVLDVNSLGHFMVNSEPEILEYLSFEELGQLISSWSYYKKFHNSSIVYFIDGIDECGSENSAKDIFSKIESNYQIAYEKPVLIISTRPSHETLVTNSLTRYSICRMEKGIGKFYSENELSEKMPIMLCDAWGLTRESGEKLSEIFGTYQDTLVHPLFVGWFCFLILEGKLEEIEDSSNVVEISQNNLIKTIIEIGVEKSLERRGSKVSEISSKSQSTSGFRDILEKFVVVAFHYNLSKPSKVFTKMKQLGFVKSVSNEIKNSIKNDCGILFLTGNNIEWTHTTIPEIIYADFYFKNDLSVNLGPIRVSEPVISRIAQLHYENGDFDSYASAELNLRHKLLPIQDFVEFLEYEMFDLHQDTSHSRVEPILCVKDSKLSPVKNRVMLNIEVEVAQLYIQSLGTRKQFALSKDYIIAEDLNDAIPLIYEQSNNPFCRDIINPIHFENVLSLDQINPAKVSADTKIADCFSYYRNLLLSHTDKDLSVDHPVLQMHKRADNFEDIFDINSVNAMTRYEIDDILSSWIEHDNPEEWYEERELLISHITSEYVLTAFERLFGEGNDETCTDMIYDTLKSTTVHIVTDTENGVVKSTNILTWLLAKHGLNEFIEIGTGMPAGILDEYAMNELVERQLVLVPFVYECLNLIESESSSKAVFASEFASFVSEYAEQNIGYWEPFELVKAYASNLD